MERVQGEGGSEGGREGGEGTYFFFSAAAFLMESRVAKRAMAGCSLCVVLWALVRVGRQA